MLITWPVTQGLSNSDNILAITTVFFDLDGTLIDTAPDMAGALTILCEENDQAALPFDVVRPHVSNGSVSLVKLAFPHITDDSTTESLKKRYLEIYQQHLCVDSCLFDGMEAVLENIVSRHLKWGVVTNKPGWLTDPLLRQLKLFDRAACVVSGDSTSNRKPHPEPMYHACELTNSVAHKCIYVGDAPRDIEAGINAGMQTLVALFGYISEKDNPATWGASAMVEHPSDITDYLCKNP